MSELISQIGRAEPRRCDTTAPRQLVVQSHAFGRVTVAAASLDPLLLQLGSVDAGTAIEVLNLSANPNADWARDKNTLVERQSAALPNGTLAVALSARKANELELRPGDRLLLRQVDQSGNASAPTLVKLKQADARIRFDADEFVQFGTALSRHVEYSVQAYSDTRPPVVLPELMHWSDGEGSNYRVLKGQNAIEPGAEVRLQNGRTRDVYSAVVQDSSELQLHFKAECGDPISITVLDAHGQSTDLGMTTYVPAEACSGTR